MRRSALALAVVLLLASCGGSRGPTVPRSKLPGLVLKRADLPKGFAQFYQGPQVTLDNQGTIRRNPTRLGREGGWIARYRRNDPRATDGPLVVESRADLFPNRAKAKDDLALYGVDFDQVPGARRLGRPRLGDGAIALAVREAGLRPTRIYRVAWRDRNVTASLLVQGYVGKVTLGDALHLARRQDARIRGAAG